MGRFGGWGEAWLVCLEVNHPGAKAKRHLSLKAKIEAVIYASEEPVTLVQLVGLLGQEGQAELDRLEDRQGSLGLDGMAVEGEGGPSGEVDGEAAGEAVTAVELLSIAHPFDEAERMAHPEQATADATTTADSFAALRKDNQHEAKDDEPVESGDPTSQGRDLGHPVSEAAEKKAAREKERKLREFFREILDELMRDYATGDRGLEVKEVAGGFRMATKPEYHDAVRGFVRSLKPVLKLSLQAFGDAGGGGVQAAGDGAGGERDPRGGFGRCAGEPDGAEADYDGGAETGDWASDSL